MEEHWIVRHPERGIIGMFASARAAKREFNRIVLERPALRSGLRLERYRSLVSAV